MAEHLDCVGHVVTNTGHLGQFSCVRREAPPSL